MKRIGRLMKLAPSLALVFLTSMLAHGQDKPASPCLLYTSPSPRDRG